MKNYIKMLQDNIKRKEEVILNGQIKVIILI